ncbi:MAG TPA: hypothetical protein DDW49_07970 [Deltaproteobacteria bacterium]|nr:hypothetical protein [Deltaproteobacteria bacterium]
MFPKNWFLLFFFVFFALTVVHCGSAPDAVSLVEPDPNAGAPNISGGAPVYYPHAEGWKNPATHGDAYRATIRNNQNSKSSLCVICHNFRKDSPTCGSCHPEFPHIENWKDPLNHGTYVRENGTANCATDCHGADLTNGLSGISCKSCHHPEGWAAADTHGLYVIQNDKESCKKCHGEDYKGGVTNTSCYNSSCHTTYPHQADWAKVENHGFFAHEEGKEDCKSCHGEDFKGGISNISCYNANCHTTYPHQADWVQVENHGLFAHENGKEDCKTCHGDDFTGGISGVTCYNANCHASYPHNEQWAQFDQHGMFALLTGVTKCKNCHGEDFKGGISEVTCYNSNCHASYPHTENWAQPENHGALAVGDAKNECKSCHGDDFTGGISGITCYNANCHANYPHQADWAQVENHGVFALQNGKEDCKACHGEEFNGGISGVSCYNANCHTAYPHLEAWQDEHGSQLKAMPGDIYENIDQTCQTSQCHGDQGIARGLPNCGNADCHPSFPDNHWDRDVWHDEGQEGHRQYALLEGTEECAKCHYENDTWSCFTCHANYPHDENWIQAENHGSSVLRKNFYWQSPYDKFNQPVFDAQCRNCHGPTVLFDNESPPTLISDFTENGVKRCYNQACHPTYPHVYYEAIDPILADLGIVISQQWEEGHRNFIYYNEGYAGINLDNNCRTQECRDRVESVLKSTMDQGGCYGASGGVCHNNNRQHPGWHVFNTYCEAACHVE